MAPDTVTLEKASARLALTDLEELVEIVRHAPGGYGEMVDKLDRLVLKARESDVMPEPTDKPTTTTIEQERLDRDFAVGELRRGGLSTPAGRYIAELAVRVGRLERAVRRLGVVANRDLPVEYLKKLLELGA